jgi:UDP-N-acetylmuramate: L-alanyl-gamma-D-glutamyl-meso-diaminopimelate ligase
MRVHFISIGGSVMHQLAIALKRKGYQVTGTDDEIFEPSRSNLLAEGLYPQKMGFLACTPETTILSLKKLWQWG